MSEITIQDTMTVGTELVDLCRQGKEHDAINKLYSPTVVSIEAGAPEGVPRRVEGLADVIGKAEWWESNNDVHARTVEGPYPHDDRFVVHFKYDITPKEGPMAGQRMQMDETALYTVKDGKIVHEEFFYSLPS
jgi:ketosteroid isomerase-like protein